MPSHRKTAFFKKLIDFADPLDWLVGIVFLLLLIGTCNVYSSTFYKNMEDGISPYASVQRHLLYMAIGFLLWRAVMHINPVKIKEHVGLLAFITVIGLFLVFAAGRTVNGATRWIGLGFLSIQPSEIAKVTGIMWAAAGLENIMRKGEKIRIFGEFRLFLIHLLDRRHGKSLGEVIRYFHPLWMPVLFATLVMLQPDMGTAGLIMVFPILLYMLSGLPKREIIEMAIFSGILFFLFSFFTPYRRARLMILWDPFSDASDKGYQTVQSLIAVGSGGLWGQGAGQGLSKYLYLPESSTDFAFAVLSQEWGFFVSAFMVFLYMAFLFLGFRLARDIPRMYAALLVYGLTMLISLQGLLNIAMVIGLFPVTGVPLPFISYGGTALVINLTSLGLIHGAVQYGRRMKEKDEREERIRRLSSGTTRSMDELSNSTFRPPQF